MLIKLAQTKLFATFLFLLTASCGAVPGGSDDESSDDGSSSQPQSGSQPSSETTQDTALEPDDDLGLTPDCSSVDDSEAFTYACTFLGTDGNPSSLVFDDTQLVAELTDGATANLERDFSADGSKGWHIRFSLAESTIRDLDRIVTTVTKNDREDTFLIDPEFSTLAGLLSWKAGDTHDFGETPIGGWPDGGTLLTLDFSGELTAIVDTDSISFSNPRFRFTGGSFPGTAGTCGTKIVSSCTIEVEFVPDRVTTEKTTTKDESSSGFVEFESGTLSLTYDNGVQDVDLALELSGEGALIATGVLGQSDFTSSSNSYFDSPAGLWFHNGSLYVADRLNNRILIWNSMTDWSSVTGKTADVVIDSTTMGSTSLSGPRAVSTDGTTLYLADSGNDRILAWDSIPTSSSVGDPDTVDTTAGTAYGNPYSVTPYDNGILVGNTRDPNTFKRKLQIMDSFSDESPLDLVDAGSPAFATVHGSDFLVSDFANNRILIWDHIPSNTDDTADGSDDDNFLADTSNVILGQESLAGSAPNMGGDPSTNTLDKPYQIDTNSSGKLVVCDRTNGRVLLFDSIPASTAAHADYAFGKPSFSNVTSNSPDRKTLNSPVGCAITEKYVFVSDARHHRVLIIPH